MDGNIKFTFQRQAYTTILGYTAAHEYLFFDTDTFGKGSHSGSYGITDTGNDIFPGCAVGELGNDFGFRKYQQT